MSDSVRARVLRLKQGAEPTETTDELAAEEPLEIRLSGQPFSVTMRTPGHDLELVAGFLLAEGLIAPAAVPLLRAEGRNVINVGSLQASRQRATAISSSCGVCGRTSMDQLRSCWPAIEDEVRIAAEVLQDMLASLEATQAAFGRTGGIHAAALFDEAGALASAHEDVGRHNAVDKVIGHALLTGRVPLGGHTLLVSGRISFEIVQKALAARIPVLAAVSAPSSLAVQFAEENGQTLVGFLRAGRCNIYSHPERIITGQAFAQE